MAAAIGPIIQLILWILGFFMNRANVSLKSKQAFYNYVQSLSEDALVSARLKQSAKDQLARLGKDKPDK